MSQLSFVPILPVPLLVLPHLQTWVICFRGVGEKERQEPSVASFCKSPAEECELSQLWAAVCCVSAVFSEHLYLLRPVMFSIVEHIQL